MTKKKNVILPLAAIVVAGIALFGAARVYAAPTYDNGDFFISDKNNITVTTGTDGILFSATGGEFEMTYLQPIDVDELTAENEYLSLQLIPDTTGVERTLDAAYSALRNQALVVTLTDSVDKTQQISHILYLGSWYGETKTKLTYALTDELSWKTVSEGDGASGAYAGGAQTVGYNDSFVVMGESPFPFDWSSPYFFWVNDSWDIGFKFDMNTKTAYTESPVGMGTQNSVWNTLCSMDLTQEAYLSASLNGMTDDELAKRYTAEHVNNLFSSGKVVLSIAGYNLKDESFDFKISALGGNSLLKEEVNFKDGDVFVDTVLFETGETVQFADIAPEAPVKAGYTFAGWADEDGAIVTEGVIGSSCTYTAVYSLGVAKGATLSLDGDIGLNFYFEFPESGAENAKVVLKAGDEILNEISVADAPVKDGMYKFKANVAAKDYEKQITATVEAGGKAETSRTYSAAEYIETVLSSEAEEFAAVRPLVGALQDYCEKAKAFFTGAEGAAAEHEEITAETLSEFACSVSGTEPEGITVYGPTLVLDSKTEIRFYFTAESLDGIVCRADGQEQTPESKICEGVTYYYLSVKNVAAKDLDESHVFEIGNYSVSNYSALSYALAVLEEEAVDGNADVNLLNIVRAMVIYNTEADRYFS